MPYFHLILQFHAILHFLPPEYRQNELLRTIIFIVLFFHNFKKNSKVPGFENVFAKFREYVLGKVKNYIPSVNYQTVCNQLDFFLPEYY